MRWLAWALDELLDRIPSYEDGRWYRYGDWGCRLRLDRIWACDVDCPG
jgi:hypothetical protein